MKLLDLLLSALAAIANLDSKADIRSLLTEIRALIAWLSFDNHTELVVALLPAVTSAVHVAGFMIDGPVNWVECIQIIVASEQAVDHVPPVVVDFVVDVLQLLLAESASLVRRLLEVMSAKDCAIKDAASLNKAIRELNDFALHPAAVTAERYERAAAGTLSDDEICKLSDVELNRLAFHAGKQFLIDKARRRPTKRHISEVCDAAEPDPKRSCGHA